MCAITLNEFDLQTLSHIFLKFTRKIRILLWKVPLRLHYYFVMFCHEWWAQGNFKQPWKKLLHYEDSALFMTTHAAWNLQNSWRDFMRSLNPVKSCLYRWLLWMEGGDLLCFMTHQGPSEHRTVCSLHRFDRKLL